ncbi:putative ArsR family transcriptional regulator [Silvibacterium bohemicum]|uniref:Putative ArsR family transcriptional regulator n=1 Tax=Silvibacterium bohemicum TaxID=1577686 RepID=A0A841K045_9BACT|nr:transcriptional regulator [Silvibacterium bohemicum]MBB6144038.1 putative ArsR family transcriptional regulator [Silvibacterium bohemicum]
MKTTKSKPTAPFAYEGLDRVIHERARLSILTSLITRSDGLSFIELKQLCGLTDGNLARHLQVLEEDGMLRISKEGKSGRAQTTARITASGRSRYLEYLTILEQVVRDAASVNHEDPKGQFLRKLSPAKA